MRTWGISWAETWGDSWGKLAVEKQYFAGAVVPGAPARTEREQIILDDDEVILRVITKFVEELV